MNYTVYTSGVILPVLAGFYRDRLRVTPGGALIAIIGGGLAALIIKLFGIEYLDLGDLSGFFVKLSPLLISGLLLLVVSFVDNRLKGWRLDGRGTI